MNFEFRSTSSMILTFFAGVLDLKASVFRYANAGHNRPYLVKGQKSMELPVAGSAIGFANSISYTEQTVDIVSGDVIALFTDGLIEMACTEDAPTIKLGPILEKIMYGNEYHRRILDTALAESGSKDFTDDVTIVTARIL
jgi:sigma-B regulation protein RsbU (phosphoserine phosphatase)